jgi:hypothetical protein
MERMALACIHMFSAYKELVEPFSAESLITVLYKRNYYMMPLVEVYVFCML